MALVLDTGPLLAAFDRRDADHARCASLLLEAGEALVIPSPVLVELDYWMRQRLPPEAMFILLDDVATGAYLIEHVATSDVTRIAQILRRYRDSDVGFVDAAVLAVVERLGETKLATLDRRHFSMLRPAHIESLRLMPE